MSQDPNLALVWSGGCLSHHCSTERSFGAGVTLVLQLAWEEVHATVICHFHSAESGCGKELEYPVPSLTMRPYLISLNVAQVLRCTRR